MPLFARFRSKIGLQDSSGDECEDKSAENLSHVGKAAYDCLRRHHNHYHHELWNVTKGKIVSLDFTPKDAFSRMDRTDPVEGHDDWFPKKVEEMISRTETWCDIMTLGPPDGLFLDAMKAGIKELCETESIGVLSNQKVIVRIMFGNILGMPVNCNKIIADITKDLPKDADKKIKLWVGSWRKGVSWNHAKIIAVDGQYLWTGGHNFWDRHYCKKSPVNDLSIEMEGGVAKDAHLYANAQWGYIVKKQSTAWGRFVDRNVPDGLDVPRTSRVTVSEFPGSSCAEFPPFYSFKKQSGQSFSRLIKSRTERGDQQSAKNVFARASHRIDSTFVPCITMGRYGRILKHARPSDDAFVAMFESAQEIIRFAVQDFGPACIPKTKLALLEWPTRYLDALAKVIWTKDVDIEIVLSNPGSIPDNLSITEAQYGNGWDCVDVAAEIIKRIQKLYPCAPMDKLREKVLKNLRLCFLRCPRGGRRYSNGSTVGLHSKHFIIDDVCCYIGSQNIYICDLAEWGVVIDDPEAVLSIKRQYWDPMWDVSYTEDDCNVDLVMHGLGIDRGQVNKLEMTKYEYQQAKLTMKQNMDTYYNDSGSEQSEAEDEDDNAANK